MPCKELRELYRVPTCRRTAAGGQREALRGVGVRSTQGDGAGSWPCPPSMHALAQCDRAAIGVVCSDPGTVAELHFTRCTTGQRCE